MGSTPSLKGVTEGPVGEAIQQHQLAVSIAIYGVVAVVAYFWLEGPVGIAGTVDGSIAAIGLALGAIMFVPIIRGWIQSNIGEGESARLGIAGVDTE